MASSFDAQVEKSIPAEIHMISGSHDSQTSADVSNVSQFQLPDPAGRAGGACTSAILQVLYKDKHQQAESLTWVELLRRMRSVLLNMGFDQVPQLTSSRLIDVHKPMYIVPPGSNGTRRAILIGINYKGQQGQLSGCHNDASNIGEFLERVHGFSRSNMLILMDDGKNHSPTKDNIINAFKRIADYSKAEMSYFFIILATAVVFEIKMATKTTGMTKHWFPSISSAAARFATMTFSRFSSNPFVQASP
ncbi:Caspase domain [Fragilaria crotonensis]|nr:Caspase domain [Fragilaria crotonensis]